MSRFRALVCTLALSCFGAVGVAQSVLEKDPSRFVRHFYEKYFAELSRKKKTLVPPLTRELAALFRENRLLCAKKAPLELCGPDFDVYLATQDVPDQASLASTKAQFRRLGPSEVEASFILFPEEASGTESRVRVRLLLRQEKGQWAIDDLTSNGVSVRARLTEENAELRRKPGKP